MPRTPPNRRRDHRTHAFPEVFFFSARVDEDGMKWASRDMTHCNRTNFGIDWIFCVFAALCPPMV